MRIPVGADGLLCDSQTRHIDPRIRRRARACLGSTTSRSARQTQGASGRRSSVPTRYCCSTRRRWECARCSNAEVHTHEDSTATASGRTASASANGRHLGLPEGSVPPPGNAGSSKRSLRMAVERVCRNPAAIKAKMEAMRGGEGSGAAAALPEGFAIWRVHPSGRASRPGAPDCTYVRRQAGLAACSFLRSRRRRWWRWTRCTASCGVCRT